jgi:hypothetical protein
MKKRSTDKQRLAVHQVLDVPLREVSGICLRRDRGGRMSLMAVGDCGAHVAWVEMTADGDVPEDDEAWETTDISRLQGSELPEDDPQLEAICADGAGRVLLLQETPPRAEVVDLDASRVHAKITLDIEGDSELALSWADEDGSHGEGAVLMANGRLLVAKEKHPSALIEFGPKGADSQGFASARAMDEGAAWPIKPGKHRFVALAVWYPDDALRKACPDFSDLEIAPDGGLYLLSDKSATIVRLDDLPAGGGDATPAARWKLDDVDGKPEGLTFSASGQAIVALDKGRKNNLLVFTPAIASPRTRAQHA